MVLSSRELERLEELNYGDRRISGSLYCENCGYNLRTLPYVYHCPECGQSYNARPSSMQGIFLPSEQVLPLGPWLHGVVFGVLSVLFLVNGLQPRSYVKLFLAIAFAGLAVVYLWRGQAKLGRYFKAREIIRRIRKEENT